MPHRVPCFRAADSEGAGCEGKLALRPQAEGQGVAGPIHEEAGHVGAKVVFFF